ncbi:LysR family transcriptional regulator [soil metagenome]
MLSDLIMDFRHLRYFACVAEEMHFGRAALRLGMSQPPLSQQIKLFEQRLGVQLFERTSRRVQLTPAGRAMLPLAQQAIAHVNLAFETARRADRGEVGTLAVGFTTSAPFVPRIASELYRFRQAYPDVELQLTELSREEQIVRLTERRLDIGIMRGFERPTLPDALRTRMLTEEPMLLAMRDDHPLASKPGPLTIADLSGEPIVLYERSLGSGFNEHFLTLCLNAGFEPNIAQEASGVATLLGLVGAGFGVTVLAKSLSALHPESITYRPIAQDDAISRLWLAHHVCMTPSCALFASAISDLAEGEVAALDDD